MRLYPTEELYGEMAFIAFHFHWSSKELMELEHQQRRIWCKEISGINRKLDSVTPDTGTPLESLM